MRPHLVFRKQHIDLARWRVPAQRGKRRVDAFLAVDDNVLGSGNDGLFAPSRFQAVRPSHPLPQRFALTGTRAGPEAEVVPSVVCRVGEHAWACNDLPAVYADERVGAADLHLVFVKCIGRVHRVFESGPVQFDAVLVQREQILVDAVAETEHHSRQACAADDLDRSAARGAHFRVGAPGSRDGQHVTAV